MIVFCVLGRVAVRGLVLVAHQGPQLGLRFLECMKLTCTQHALTVHQAITVEDNRPANHVSQGIIALTAGLLILYHVLLVHILLKNTAVPAKYVLWAHILQHF